MTPEGIRFVRFELAGVVAEAVACIRAAILAHGEPYARDAYHLDDWDMRGIPAGEMAVERALSVLETQNELRAGG